MGVRVSVRGDRSQTSTRNAVDSGGGEPQLKREKCFCGSRVARLGLRRHTTGASRQEALKFELQFSQVAQANAMGNGPQTGAALRWFAPGANRNRQRKLGLTSAHVKNFTVATSYLCA